VNVLELSNTETALESAGCPVCGSAGELRFQQRDLLCGLGGEFGQRQCRPCGVYFLSPRVPEDQIASYYPASYEPYQPGVDPWLVRKLAALLKLTGRRRRLVERFVPGGKLLDVGCGNGGFLRELAEPTTPGAPETWQRYATDTQWHGQGDCPGTFHAGIFDQQPPPFRGLDAITLWHVFEHLYHPDRALENAFRVLRPGGFLFLAIPDLKSLEPRVFGKCWVGWDPPRHIATYSAKGMEQLLTRNGFRLVEILPDTTSGALLLLNVDFLLQSRGIQWRVFHSLWLRLLVSPLVYLLSALGLAPAKVYVAQR
jgi:SAM-dependent methyltransferase